MSNPAVHILGIRHHGPGSARSVRAALETIRPDVVLVEGPGDADEILPLAGDKEMRPPVAILIYATADPRQAVYYPFAVFSPEWQAIQYALERNVPLRFVDLPKPTECRRRRGRPRVKFPFGLTLLARWPRRPGTATANGGGNTSSSTDGTAPTSSPRSSKPCARCAVPARLPTISRTCGVRPGCARPFAPCRSKGLRTSP